MNWGQAGSKIKHVVLAESLREPFSQSSQGVDNGADLKPLDSWRAENDSRVGPLVTDGILGENDEVANISGDQAPTYPSCVGELLPVRKLNVPHFEGTYRINSPFAESLGNLRGEVLV